MRHYWSARLLLMALLLGVPAAAFAQGTNQPPYSGAPGGYVMIPGPTAQSHANSTPNRPMNYFSPADPFFVGPNARACCRHGRPRGRR